MHWVPGPAGLQADMLLRAWPGRTPAAAMKQPTAALCGNPNISNKILINEYNLYQDKHDDINCVCVCILNVYAVIHVTQK